MRDDEDDDLDAWDEENPERTLGLDAAGGATIRNGHAPIRDEEPNARDEADEDIAPDGWSVSGGVVHWEGPSDAEDLTAEADSPLAAEDLTLPDGAPDAPRVRAVHAWLARQWLGEREALGTLQLALRERQAEADEPAPRRRHATPPTSPLELEIARHQAAADEYAALRGALAEEAAHAGPGQLLVGFYLWLTERLVAMTLSREAKATAPTTPAEAEWRGRAEAGLAARMRIERVMAPTPDDE
jgi:hypothetical protein